MFHGYHINIFKSNIYLDANYMCYIYVHTEKQAKKLGNHTKYINKFMYGSNIY